MSEIISIVVPVYNASQVIDRCVNSILKQTYHNWELLLIDDGSNDDSFSKCKKYAETDNRIKAYTKTNGGVSSARNKGIQCASGEYICFVDADDAIENDMLSQLYSVAKKYESDMIICGSKHFVGTDVVVQKPLEESINGEIEIANYVQEHYLEWLISAPWGKLYKRNLLPVRGFDESISLGEDLKFNIQYFQKIHKIYTISDTLYLYYDNIGSLTKTYKPGNYGAIINIYEITKDYIYAVDGANKYWFKNINYKLFSFCISFMSQNMSVEKSREAKKFIKDICNNANLQNAITYLPELSYTRKVYVMALRKRWYFMLYLLSRIKNRFID